MGKMWEAHEVEWLNNKTHGYIKKFIEDFIFRKKLKNLFIFVQAQNGLLTKTIEFQLHLQSQ